MRVIYSMAGEHFSLNVALMGNLLLNTAVNANAVSLLKHGGLYTYHQV
jgi:hypothetical protein